jgi:hypothetical protein
MSKIRKAQKRASKRGPDAILATHVSIANQLTEDKTVIGVTLTVGGAVVTGEIIADWAWADRAHQQIVSAGGGTLSGYSVWRDRLIERRDDNAAAIGERVEGVEPTDEQRIAHANADPGFIHLANAQVFTGNTPVPSGSSALWRGRLVSVDGWIPGIFRASFGDGE